MRKFSKTITISIVFITTYFSNYFVKLHYSFQYLAILIPVFIISNIILIIINKNNLKKFLIAGFSLLFALPHFCSTIQLTLPKKENKAIKILSYNVHGFNKPANNDFSKTNIEETNNFITAIYQTDADIICLQEFYDFDGSQIYNSIKKISGANYPYYAMEPEIISRSGIIVHKFGNITFSKHPILNHKCIRFINSGNNQILVIQIIIEKDTFEIYNCHLTSFNNISDFSVTNRIDYFMKQKKIQSDILVKLISDSKYPKIVCGDFNDTQFGYSYFVLKNILNNSFEKAGNFLGLSYPVNFPVCRIDHIFVEKYFKINNHQILTHIKYSDHFPVMVSMQTTKTIN